MWKLLFSVALCLHCACAGCPAPPKPQCNDRNATSGCGINCGRHCLNVFNPPKNKTAPVICNALCREGGCDCKKNYWQDDNQNGKCVLAEDCVKPSCPKNQEYVLCPKTCPPMTCATKDALFKCAAPLKYPDPNCRPPGCQCKPGFYKNSNGDCVTKDQCDCDSEDSDSTDTDSSGSSNTDTQQLVEKFNNGNAAFSGNFYSQVSKDQPGASTIMSPYSLEFLLGQLALYADGDSYKQLIRALGLSSKDEIRKVVPAVLNSIDSVKNLTLNLAFRVYNNQIYKLSSGFIKDSHDVFRAVAQALDCSKPAQAAGIVNDWVANKTNNRIQNILSADAITDLTRLILVNAIYFKGNWLQQFNKNLTQDRDFTKENKQVIQVKTMYKEGASYRYGYSDELGCEALEMPYTNEEFTFTIYLPQVGGLAALQEKFRNSSAVLNFRKNLIKQKITIFIPVFKIETTIDLAQLLKSIGITGIFKAGNSGLNGLLEVPEDIYVSEAVQKAFIEVNEEGAEAAAANVIGVSATSSIEPSRPSVFLADHPFVYEIRRGDVTMFLGTFSGK